MSTLFILLASTPILKICIVIIVVGVLLWVVTTQVPMDPTIKKLLVAVVVIALVIWILKSTGLWNGSF